MKKFCTHVGKWVIVVKTESKKFPSRTKYQITSLKKPQKK